MKNFVFGLLILITASCASKKDVSGIYKSNIADLGFFITTIELKKDSTFSYNFAGDLANTDLTGNYRIKDKNVYLKFNKNKGEIESESDSLNISEILSGNYHNYNLKNEAGSAYHLKYLIRDNRLYSYRIDNGKLVKFGKYYSDRKKWEKKRVYLCKKY